jgi:O-antigen/teichoic acid export membrane protein
MKKSYSKKVINKNSIKNPILNVGRETLLYIPAKLFPALFGFIGLTTYTRIFSPAEFGTYSLIMATIGIIGVFTYSWINQSNLRLFQPYRNDHKLDLFFSTSFFLQSGALIGSSIILFILSSLSLLPLEITKYMLLLIEVLFSTSLFETVMTILMSDRKPKTYSVFRSLSVISYLVISLLFIYILNYRISAIFIGYFLTNLILFVVIIFKLQFYKYVSLNSFSSETLKEFISYGIPLLAALMFSWILMLSDRYLIEYFRGSYEVGLYSASYQLADSPIGLISSTIIMAAFPIILDTWEEKGDQVTIDLISNIMKYYLLFAIPTLVYVIILSQEFMLILGNSYLDGYTVLPWICFGSLILGLCTYINKGLELKKKTRILSFIVGLAAISNVLLNLILIPRYGFYGAGMATGVAYLIYFIVSIAISRKYLICRIPLKSTLNFSLSSLIMGISLLLLKGYLNESLFSLFLVTSIGAIVYVISIFLSGEIKYELIFIKSYLNSMINNV